jgi:hypothetical protein
MDAASSTNPDGVAVHDMKKPAKAGFFVGSHLPLLKANLKG